MNTSTAQTTGLTVLDEALELGLVQHVLSGSVAADMRVNTKLTITGTSEEGRYGYADLKFWDGETVGESTVGVDAGQARQLAAYLLQVADELEARVAGN